MSSSINKKYLLLSFLIIFIMAALTVIALFTNSYAVDTYVSLPDTTFKSNKSTDNNINLIKEALINNESYTNFFDNFNVEKDYKTYDNSLPLYSLMKNLKYPTLNESFEITDNNPKEINDKGLTYILTHGYNPTNTINTIFTKEKYGKVEDDTIKEYITQIALWLYIYENDPYNLDYCIKTNIDEEVNSCSFYNTETNTLMPIESIKGIINQAATNKDYKYLNYIIELVNIAKTYKYNESTMKPISNASIGYNYYDDHIVTNLITPSSTKESIDNYLDYSVEISDPENYGVFITNKDGVKITKMNSINEGFKIYIPLKDDITTMDLTKVRISIKGTFIDDTKSYSYKVSKDGFASTLIGYVTLKEEYAGFNLKNFTRISNSINGREIPGGTLVIKDKQTAIEVAKWVTKSKPHNIILKEGTYELCQEAIGDKYILNHKCVEFKIENNKINSEKIENKLSNSIANIASTSSVTAYIIGIILFIISGSIILYSFKTNKISVK